MPDRAILLCPYNHSQQLKGEADGTSIYPRDPIQEKENDYKRGKREIEGGSFPPNRSGMSRKAPRIMPKTNFLW